MKPELMSASFTFGQEGNTEGTTSEVEEAVQEAIEETIASVTAPLVKKGRRKKVTLGS